MRTFLLRASMECSNAEAAVRALEAMLSLGAIDLLGIGVDED